MNLRLEMSLSKLNYKLTTIENIYEKEQYINKWFRENKIKEVMYKECDGSYNSIFPKYKYFFIGGNKFNVYKGDDGYIEVSHLEENTVATGE